MDGTKKMKACSSSTSIASNNRVAAALQAEKKWKSKNRKLEKKKGKKPCIPGSLNGGGEDGLCSNPKSSPPLCMCLFSYRTWFLIFFFSVMGFKRLKKSFFPAMGLKKHKSFFQQWLRLKKKTDTCTRKIVRYTMYRTKHDKNVWFFSTWFAHAIWIN